MAATVYHAPPPAPGNATVTALAYRRAAPGGGRHPVPHKTGSRRRRLESGFEVQGNLFSLGYFSANVCFGTPGQRFDLIIDTGSSLTAMPCQGCSHCGSHSHEASGGLPAYSRARFDGAASSTYTALDCQHARCYQSGRCSGSTCPYGVSYSEGSSIRGHMALDVAWFARRSSAAGHASVACEATFGCQTSETNLFHDQVADGICGFSQSQSYGPTLFDWLRLATGAPDVFSICLHEETGAMVLGGSVRDASRHSWIPYTGGHAYTVALDSVRAGQLG